MRLPLLCITLLQGLLVSIAAPGVTRRLTLEEISERHTRRTPGGIHLPIVGIETLERRNGVGIASAIGLGDLIDL
jgi:phytepsin